MDNLTKLSIIATLIIYSTFFILNEDVVSTNTRNKPMVMKGNIKTKENGFFLKLICFLTNQSINNLKPSSQAFRVNVQRIPFTRIGG